MLKRRRGAESDGESRGAGQASSKVPEGAAELYRASGKKVLAFFAVAGLLFVAGLFALLRYDRENSGPGKGEGTDPNYGADAAALR